MAESVDAPDLKSVDLQVVRVQVSPQVLGSAKGSCSSVRIKGANTPITIEMYIMSEQNIHAYGTVNIIVNTSLTSLLMSAHTMKLNVTE